MCGLAHINSILSIQVTPSQFYPRHVLFLQTDSILNSLLLLTQTYSITQWAPATYLFCHQDGSLPQTYSNIKTGHYPKPIPSSRWVITPNLFHHQDGSLPQTYSIINGGAVDPNLFHDQWGCSWYKPVPWSMGGQLTQTYSIITEQMAQSYFIINGWLAQTYFIINGWLTQTSFIISG